MLKLTSKPFPLQRRVYKIGMIKYQDLYMFLSICAPESDSWPTPAAEYIALHSEGSPVLMDILLFTVFSLWQAFTGMLHNNSAELLQVFIDNT